MSTNPKNKKIEDNTSLEGNNASKADLSKILAPEVETKKLQELARMLAENMGLSHFQQEIDVLKETDKVLITKLEEVVNSLNQTVNTVNAVTGSIQGNNQTQQTPNITTGPNIQNFDMQKLEVVGTLLEKVFGAYEKYKSATAPSPTSILPTEEINEYLKKSMTGNFELGAALVDQLKNKVVGKAMTKIVTGIVNHEPE